MKFIQVYEEADTPDDKPTLHLVNMEQIVTLFRRDNGTAGLWLTTFSDPLLLRETYEYIFSLMMQLDAVKG